MKIELELQPFVTPNFVIVKMPPQPRDQWFVESPKLPLSEVDSQTLAEMCDEFRKTIFMKAGKDDPSAERPS